MAREHGADEHLAVTQHTREAIQEPGVLLGAPVAGERVEARPEPGQGAQDVGPGRFASGRRDYAEGRLPDEPRGRLAARPGARGDPGEFIGPEADQLGRRAERGWGRGVSGQASNPFLLHLLRQWGKAFPATRRGGRARGNGSGERTTPLIPVPRDEPKRLRDETEASSRWARTPVCIRVPRDRAK
jgi:hypothetical protein